ncbi:MAG: hypothetical protein GY931_10305 [Maribacter sp.]|nr:hypothetical protein [Maribacter sp.]
MKKITNWAIGALFCIGGTTQLLAQEVLPGNTTQNIDVQKYTVMEQYEPELVLSVDERIRLKKKRVATIKRRMGILDTLDISDRRRQKLLKALLKNPFSDKLNKAVADIEFLEDKVEN